MTEEENIKKYIDEAEKELREPILTDKEKEYLQAIIKPFRKDSPITIEKHRWAWGNERECIIIWLSNINNPNIKEIISFPYFKTGEMYRGMEADKEYTLEELGL